MIVIQIMRLGFANLYRLLQNRRKRYRSRKRAAVLQGEINEHYLLLGQKAAAAQDNLAEIADDIRFARREIDHLQLRLQAERDAARHPVTASPPGVVRFVRHPSDGKICTSCEALIPENSSFCPNCGAAQN